MSHQIDLAAVAAPHADFDVFPFMNRLKQEATGLPPSPLLQRFHDALLERFPDSPWMKEYAGDHGRLTLMQRAHDILPHILHIAAGLGLTVVDKKAVQVHRPPTYQVKLQGVAAGVEASDAASRLAALMKQPVEHMAALLASGQQPVVKKGITRTQAMTYVDALRNRGGCDAAIVLEPGAVEHPEPPPPPPPPSRAAPVAAAVAAKPAPRAVEAVVAEEEAGSGADRRLFDIAEGIRLMCSAIGLNFLFNGMLGKIPPMPAFLGSTLLSALMLVGGYRLAKALECQALTRAAVVAFPVVSLVLAVVAVFAGERWLFIAIGVALLDLVLVVSLAWRGSRRLKREGFKVGLFGASKLDVRMLGGLPDGEKLTSTLLAWAVFCVVGLIVIASPKDFTRSSRDMFITDADRPCAYVGEWHLQREGVAVATLVLSEDGSASTVVAGNASEHLTSHWHVKDGALVMVHKSGPKQGRERLPAQLDSAGTTLTLQSAGNVLRMERGDRGTLRRCAN